MSWFRIPEFYLLITNAMGALAVYNLVSVPDDSRPAIFSRSRSVLWLIACR